MSWQSISESTRKARKEHKCVWCGEPILIGESHLVSTGTFEGRFQSNRYHDECRGPAAEICQENEGFSAYAFKRGTTDEAGMA